MLVKWHKNNLFGKSVCVVAEAQIQVQAPNIYIGIKPIKALPETFLGDDKLPQR